MEGVKRRKKTKSIYHLKLLTKYLITQNPKILDILTNTYLNDYQQLINRAYSYFLLYPKLINYMNIYLNHKFEPPLKKELKKWLFTFSEIARMYNITNTNQLHYQKYKIQNRNNFNKIIRNYYDSYNINISKNDVTAIYQLYLKNIISEIELNNLKNIIDGKDHITKNQKKITEAFSTYQPKTDEFSPQIKDFCKNVKNYIRNRPVCQDCPLYSKGSVILDTNMDKPGPVDIVIFGLNPDKNEYEKQRNFIGKSGQMMHKYFDILVKKYKLRYVILNSILCWTNNASEIPTISNVLKNCKPIIDEISRQFPAKLKILFGADVMKSKGIKGGITKFNGQLVDDYFIILHPSAILRSPNKLSQFETAFLNLKEQIKNLDNMSYNVKNPITESYQFAVPKQSILTKFDKNLTLFDIQIINNKTIYIMIDSNGNKKYIIKDISVPIYLKSGSYKDCEYFSDKVDTVAYLTLDELQTLKQKLYYSMKHTTQ